MTCLSGQPQEHQKTPLGSEDEKGPSLPPMVLVEIVEDEARANAADAAKAEELAVQKSMYEQAERMADFTVTQTVLTGIGALLVLGSLFLAWQANRAAVNAVSVTQRIGNRQLRAYVGFLGVDTIQLSDKGLRFQPKWKNYGQTRARKVITNVSFLVVDGDRGLSKGFDYSTTMFENSAQTTLGPGQEQNFGNIEVKPELVDILTSKRGRVFFWGWAEYYDELTPSVRRRTEWCHEMVATNSVPRNLDISEGNFWYFWFDHAQHNGTDDDCLKSPETI